MMGIIEVSSHKTTESDNNFAIGSSSRIKPLYQLFFSFLNDILNAVLF
jgi:hypothetical protein